LFNVLIDSDLICLCGIKLLDVGSNSLPAKQVAILGLSGYVNTFQEATHWFCQESFPVNLFTVNDNFLYHIPEH
jgi:hypothetical protein